MGADSPAMAADLSRDILLEARDVSVCRQRRVILDHVSLAVSKGQHLTMVGPNGAGKTMLLKVLLGLERIDGGAVLRQPGLRIGYMPQRLHLSPLMPLAVKGFLALARPQSGAAIEEALHLTEALHLLERSIHELSGGEMQRVLLARALLRQPDLLLLDEPGQNIDISGQLAMYELIRRIQLEKHCAVLMVSHDLHFVMRQTDRVLCLYHHVCCTGRPQEIVSDERFTALFGPRIAEVMGLYHHHHGHTHEHFPARDQAAI